jgi:hypothetical protein
MTPTTEAVKISIATGYVKQLLKWVSLPKASPMSNRVSRNSVEEDSRCGGGEKGRHPISKMRAGKPQCCIR